MTKTTKIIIFVSVIVAVLFVIGLVLNMVYLNNKKQSDEKEKTEAQRVAREYLLAYGNYDAKKDPVEYVNSFRVYLTPDQSQNALNQINANADKETRDYERSINYKITTEISDLKLNFFSSEQSKAELNAYLKKTFSSTAEASRVQNEVVTVFMVKQNGNWFVDHTESLQKDIPTGTNSDYVD